MDPIIKWPGGKTRELGIIKENIPQHDRFFEPFFGGGAIGFNLEPETAFVNDIDKLLINFYEDVKSPDSKFYTDFPHILHDWRLLEELVDPLLPYFLELFPDTIDKLSDLQIPEVSSTILTYVGNSCDYVFADMKFTRYSETLEFVKKSLKSKISRVIKLQIKHDTIFDDTLLEEHLLTALKAGYYTLIRNKYFNQNPSSASFYFIREFCYGSMFRFNKKGEFNIPYGGINYNFKDIESKFAYLKSEKVQSVLDNFKFTNLDFDDFMSSYELKQSDFIFLDPPYDTDFKNYGKNPFHAEDQRRLANTLETCQAKWLLVIKKSDLIWDLYNKMADNNENVSILAYDKKYTYNVRGRNDRDVSHLLIKNF